MLQNDEEDDSFEEETVHINHSEFMNGGVCIISCQTNTNHICTCNLLTEV